MEPSFISLPAFRLIGLHLKATPMSPDIPALWDRFMAYEQTLPTVSPNVSYGVMHNFDTQAMTFDYWCALAVATDTPVPADCVELRIPAQEYAVFSATFGALGDAYGYYYNTWLPAAGYTQTDGPYFERYGVDFDATPDAPVDLYFPIRANA